MTILLIWILCAIFSTYYLYKHDMIRSFSRPFTVGDLFCLLFAIGCIFVSSPIIVIMCFTEYLEERGHIISKPFAKILDYQILKEKDDVKFD